MLLFLFLVVCAERAAAVDVSLSSLSSLLREWPSTTLNLPSQYESGVPVIDFVAADAYMQMQSCVERGVPFVLTNAPGAASASARWTPSYLLAQLPNLTMDTFPFRDYRHGIASAGRERWPNSSGWWHDAWGRGLHIDEALTASGRRVYLQESATRARFIADDLPAYGQAKGEASAVNPLPQGEILKGHPAVSSLSPLECRFGLKGTTVEAHFDSYENFLTLIRGSRRFILAHPDGCSSLKIARSPSRLRHSLLNWTDVDAWSDVAKAARAAQVVLSEGQMLYIPPFWFHFIVSLTPTAQCSKMIATAVFTAGVAECLGTVAVTSMPPTRDSLIPPADLHNPDETEVGEKSTSGHIFEDDATSKNAENGREMSSTSTSSAAAVIASSVLVRRILQDVDDSIAGDGGELITALRGRGDTTQQFLYGRKKEKKGNQTSAEEAAMPRPSMGGTSPLPPSPSLLPPAVSSSQAVPVWAIYSAEPVSLVAASSGGAVWSAKIFRQECWTLFADGDSSSCSALLPTAAATPPFVTVAMLRELSNAAMLAANQTLRRRLRFSPLALRHGEEEEEEEKEEDRSGIVSSSSSSSILEAENASILEALATVTTRVRAVQSTSDNGAATKTTILSLLFQGPRFKPASTYAALKLSTASELIEYTYTLEEALISNPGSPTTATPATSRTLNAPMAATTKLICLPFYGTTLGKARMVQENALFALKEELGIETSAVLRVVFALLGLIYAFPFLALCSAVLINGSFYLAYRRHRHHKMMMRRNLKLE